MLFYSFYGIIYIVPRKNGDTVGSNHNINDDINRYNELSRIFDENSDSLNSRTSGLRWRTAGLLIGTFGLIWILGSAVYASVFMGVTSPWNLANQLGLLAYYFLLFKPYYASWVKYKNENDEMWQERARLRGLKDEVWYLINTETERRATLEIIDLQPAPHPVRSGRSTGEPWKARKHIIINTESLGISASTGATARLEVDAELSADSESGLLWRVIVQGADWGFVHDSLRSLFDAIQPSTDLFKEAIQPTLQELEDRC